MAQSARSGDSAFDFPEHVFLDPEMVSSIDYSRMTRGKDKSYSREWNGLRTATRGRIAPGRINTGYTIARVADLSGTVRLGPMPVAFDACDFRFGTLTQSHHAAMFEACRFADGLEVEARDSEINRCVVMRTLRVAGGVSVKDTYVSGRICVGGGPGAVLDGVVCDGPVDAYASPMTITDSYSATGWIIGPNRVGRSDGYCRLSRPGQLVVVPDDALDRPTVDTPDDGTIGVVTESEALAMFGDFHATFVQTAVEAERRMRMFSSLLGRPRDDSAGQWLDGRNVNAWMAFVEAGGANGTDADAAHLALALALYPNQ